MALDLSTLYIVAGLGMLVAGIVHLIPVATGRFGRWAALWGSGHLVVGFGAIVAIVNDRVGIGWAPNVGNPAAIMGYALITGAVLAFARPTVRLTPVMAIAALLALPLVFCSDPAHFHLRVAYLNIVRAGFDVAIVTVAIRMARRDGLQTGWIVAALFGVTVPMFLGRAWLAYGDRIGSQLTGMHDDLGAWLAAGQIAFIIFRAFSLAVLHAERGEKALLDQTERDWLTGALNRAGLDRVARGIAGHGLGGAGLSRTGAGRVSVMMLDVDRFKTLNDTRGHAAGDAALRELADIAHAALGRHGHLVRWGGDEFVCLLPDTPIDQAKAIGTRIADQFAHSMAHRVPAEIGSSASLSASPGVSIGVIEAAVTTPIADLIARADQAMYMVKGDRRQPIAYHKAA